MNGTLRDQELQEFEPYDPQKARSLHPPNSIRNGLRAGPRRLLSPLFSPPQDGLGGLPAEHKNPQNPPKKTRSPPIFCKLLGIGAVGGREQPWVAKSGYVNHIEPPTLPKAGRSGFFGLCCIPWAETQIELPEGFGAKVEGAEP